MSRRVRRERKLTSMEDIEQRMNGLEKMVEDTLGIHKEEINNIHYLVSMLKHYQIEFGKLRETVKVVNDYLEEKKIKADFEKWAKDLEDKERKQLEGKEDGNNK